jgi:Glyoxalase-like domain
LYVFDHLVHLVHSPKKAMQAARECGIHAVEGGSHSDWGTANTLCYFDLSYIEYLGVENPSVAEKARGNPLVRQALEDLATGEGPARIALRTDNLEEAARLLKEQGWKVAGPFPGSRTRPDGTVLRWSLLFPEGPADELPPPFLIQWEQTDEERRKDLKQRGAIAPHSAGDLRLNHVAFAVRDLGRAAEWEKGFGLKPGKEYVDKVLNAVCRELLLTGGDLLFCAPIGDGPVARVLQTRGERPFLVTFSGAERDEDWRIFGGVYRFFRER